MNRKKLTGENLVCKVCGKEYDAYYAACPYCRAERRAKTANPRRLRRSALELWGSIALAVVLLVGAVFIVRQFVTAEDKAFARPNGVTIDDIERDEEISAGVTKQDIYVSADITDPVEETTPVIIDPSTADSTSDEASDDTAEESADNIEDTEG